MAERLLYTSWVEVSAALMVVGVFGTWVHVGADGVSGSSSGNHGWVVLTTAVLAAGVFWFRRRTRSAGVYVALIGAVAVAAVVYDRTHLASAIGGGSVVAASAQAGWGLEVALVASLSLTVAGATWVAAAAGVDWAWLPETPAAGRSASAIDQTTRENERSSARP